MSNLAKRALFLVGCGLFAGIVFADENMIVINNLKQIGLAIAQYSSDYANSPLPDMSSPAKFRKPLMLYAGSDKIFVHPATGEPFLPNPRMQGHSFQEDSDSVVMFESKPDQGTRAVLFNDGHVTRLTEDEWQALRVKQQIPASLADLYDAKLNNLRLLGQALIEYVADGNKTLPPLNDVATMKNLLLPYTGMQDIFAHPDTHQPYGINSSLAQKKMAAIASPDKIVVFYEAQPSNDVRGVLFLNGKVERVAETNWPVLKQQSGIP